MPDMDLTAHCDALREQTAEVRHEAIALREQAATLCMLVAERRAEIALAREQSETLRRVIRCI